MSTPFFFNPRAGIPYLWAYLLRATMLALLLPGVIAAQESAGLITDLISKAQHQNLAHAPTWKKLLRYNRNLTAGTVLADDFYLSPSGRSDPQSELAATIEAYFRSWSAETHLHPRCRFPARYLWLSRYLPLPGHETVPKQCTHLEKWALLDQVRSISLYLIGGYFGNPASTFGHAILKVNTETEGSALGLFDVTASYGARVPENEFFLRYALKGTFGGYDATFTDRYFYAQDLIYSRTEFRDIWDYRLALTEDERNLIILHIWEILAQPFDYYFFQTNCAYRLAEVVELVVDGDLAGTGGLAWYPPAKLFFRLDTLQKERTAAGQSAVYDSVTFVPSSQRALVHELHALSAEQRTVFDRIIAVGIGSLFHNLTRLDPEKRHKVLDALLAYHNYRVVAAGKEPPVELKEFRDKVLLARLNLPSAPRALAVPRLPSPAEGSAPNTVGIGVASDGRNTAFPRLTWSAFKLETVGNNSLEGDELVVADIAVGGFEEDQEIFLDRLDALRVVNFDLFSESDADSSGISWQLRIGSQRVDRYVDTEYDGLLTFGAGKAWRLSPYLLGYGMLDLGAHTLATNARMRPHLGLRADFGTVKLWGFGGAESDGYEGDFQDVWGAKIQLQTAQHSSINFEASSEVATRFSLGLNWYF
jgi:hypothetical protein